MASIFLPALPQLPGWYSIRAWSVTRSPVVSRRGRATGTVRVESRTRRTAEVPWRRRTGMIPVIEARGRRARAVAVVAVKGAGSVTVASAAGAVRLLVAGVISRSAAIACVAARRSVSEGPVVSSWPYHRSEYRYPAQRNEHTVERRVAGGCVAPSFIRRRRWSDDAKLQSQTEQQSWKFWVPGWQFKVAFHRNRVEVQLQRFANWG